MKKVSLLAIIFLLNIFYLSAQSKDNSNSREVVAEPEPETIFTIVEQMPEFIGGDEGLKRFIGKNIRYPKSSSKNGVEGTVYASFIVNKNGEIEAPMIQKGIDEACDQEVLRILNLMPEWRPGRQSGRNVSVRFCLPFRFKLPQSTSKK